MTLKNITLVLGALLLTASVGIAGTDSMKDSKEMKDSKDMKEIMAPTPTQETKDWSIELGSGVLWSNVRSSGNKGYTIVPIDLTASLTLDEVSNGDFLDGVFRGNTEFFFRGNYSQIVSGPDTHYEGLIVGPRYNFVQPNWVVVPYVEGGVGFLFADSHPERAGLGQDFNFTFITGAGFKYKIDDSWFLRLGAEYQHVSNAGLSEPQFANKPIDALGPKLSVGYSF